MIVIHKFILDKTKTELNLPARHKVVACHNQDNLPHIWVMLEDALPLQSYIFYLRRTGEPITINEIYLGTVFLDENSVALHVTKEIKSDNTGGKDG